VAALAYLTIGPPGVGKTTFVSWRLVGAGLVAPADVLSPDEWLWEDGEYLWTPEGARIAWARTRPQFERLCLSGRPFAVDATFVTADARRPWLRATGAAGVAAVGVFFDVPASVARTRNAARQPASRVIPDEVLERMYERLEPPTLKEGFAEVWRVGLDGAVER
jgi:predicted kinase